MQMLQIPVASYHLLCWHLSQEEAVLPELCQHCYLWGVGDLHCLCSDCLRAVWLLEATKCIKLFGKQPRRACAQLLNFHVCIAFQF